MGREVARALDRREVTGLVVGGYALHKVVEQGQRAAAARGQAQLAQVARRKAQLGQVGHWQCLRRPQRCQGGGVARDLMRLQMLGLEPAQPGVLVGREDRKPPTGGGQHFAALGQHMVLEGAQVDPGSGQPGAHQGVAGQRRRLVVVVGHHELHAKLAGQLRHHLAG